MSIVMLVLAVILIIAVVWLAAYLMYNKMTIEKRLGECGGGVRVKHSVYWYPVFYTVFVLFQAAISFVKLFGGLSSGSGLERVSHLLFLISWLALAVIFIADFAVGRIYITPEGVLSGGGKHGLTPARNCYYKLGSDRLRLYFKGVGNGELYSIAGDINELKDILESNYTLYAG